MRTVSWVAQAILKQVRMLAQELKPVLACLVLSRSRWELASGSEDWTLFRAYLCNDASHWMCGSERGWTPK